LPAEGFQGTPPIFSLPNPSDRELDVWAQAWRTPQASMWAKESWRVRTVEQWVRWSVRMEDPEAPASVVAGVLRMADQIGLSPAGLKENGWALSVDQVSKRREAKPEAAVLTRRLRAVSNE